jgi:hypothetical protein
MAGAETIEKMRSPSLRLSPLKTSRGEREEILPPRLDRPPEGLCSFEPLHLGQASGFARGF